MNIQIKIQHISWLVKLLSTAQEIPCMMELIKIWDCWNKREHIRNFKYVKLQGYRLLLLWISTFIKNGRLINILWRWPIIKITAFIKMNVTYVNSVAWLIIVILPLKMASRWNMYGANYWRLRTEYIVASDSLIKLNYRWKMQQNGLKLQNKVKIV
jgi:hypothetical protein